MSLRRADTRKAALARVNTTTRKPKKTLQDIKQGITTLYEPDGSESPEVDIVFVPGLGADPINSWKSNTTEFNWSKDEDGIRRDFPKSRILLYSYESAWIGPLKVKQYLGNLASTLLHGLRSSRESCERRPIVFVAHSMGGLVIAKAITVADTQRDKFPAMFETFAGCIFFGTPFGGTVAAAAASLLALVGQKFDKATCSTLLDQMKPEDESLRELRDEFLRLAVKLSPKIEVFCFYEEQPTNFAKLAGLPSWLPTPKDIAQFVTRESATLAGHGNAEMGLACIHRDLVKFDGSKDERYQLVRSPLKSIIHGAKLVVRNRLKSTQNINHQTITEVMEVLDGAQVQRKRKALSGKYAASSWLTKEKEYLDWVHTAPPHYDIGPPASPNSPTTENIRTMDCLWIEGPEGRGKTNNMIAAIDEIERMMLGDIELAGDQPPSLLAYFFCEPIPDYSTAEDLLKSLLWQLVKQQGVLAPYARPFVKKKGKENASKSTRQLTVENMWQVLQDMLSDEFVGRRIYFLINNLHVLPEDSESTTKLMGLINSELKTINIPNQKRVPVRWLFTSRKKYVVREGLNVPGVRLIDLEDGKYENQVQLELRKHANVEVKKLCEEKNYNKAAAYFASSLIGKRAQNKQWIDIACIQLKEIRTDVSELTVRHILEDMPQELALLLERTWHKIFSLNSPDVESIHEMLRSLILTFEDPTEAELGVLTGLCPESDKGLGEKRLEEKSKLRQLVEQCKPLLVVKRIGGSVTDVKISFMNSVVKDHLLSNAEKLLGLSKDATAWHHGVLSLRSLSDVMKRLDYIEPEHIEGTESDKNDDNHDSSEEDADDAHSGDKWEDDVEDFSEDDSDWAFDSEDEEEDPETDNVREVGSPLAYMVKHWLHHASKATEEIAEELSSEEEFWKSGSLIRRRWLIEYARLNPSAFEDLDLDRNLSALHVAASVGFSQLVVALIKHGHDGELSLRDANDDTPLHLAAHFGRVNIVEELLNKGCIVDDGIKEGNDTPLWNAALKGHVAIMRKLINRGADVNACVPDDIGSVVNAAIYSGNREAIELLIEKKASLSIVGSQDEGNYALSVAAQFSDLPMFEYLINSCAEKLAPEEYDAALVAAAEAGRVEVFTKLLTFTHSKECYQQALNVATIEENWDVIMLLLEHYQGETLDYGDVFRKASGTSENHDVVLQAVWRHAKGRIAPEILNWSLNEAAFLGKLSTVQKLLSKRFGADPDAADEEFGTALTAIAYNGNLSLVKALLDRRANVNAPDGWALQKAAAEGHKDIVEELLHRGADVNAHTMNPKFPAGTALQAACEAGKSDIVELLLSNKADPDLGPTPDTCPLIAATEGGEERIVELLIKAHANVNVSDREGCTPLINAAMLLPKESVELLIEAGAEINSFDDNGNTALISAAEVGDQDTVEYLLARGADIMQSNNKGLNALQIAVENKNEDCLPPLVNHVSEILSVIKTAMGAGNCAITDVIKGVKFLKGDKTRRGSNTSFFANDDTTLPAPSIRDSEDMANDDISVRKSIDTDEPLLEGLNTLFDDNDTSELEGNGENENGQSAKISETDEHSSIVLDFLFNNTSEENRVALERNGPRPKELVRPMGSDFFQEPSLSFMANESVEQPRPQSDYTSPVQMKIKRKQLATLASIEPLLAPLPARSEYASNPYQQEVSNLPPQQSKPDSISPGTSSGQSTVSNSPNISSQRYQPWRPEQRRYNQASPPPPQRTQNPAPLPSPEVQAARLRPFIPYNPQSYSREQDPESISPWKGSPPSLSQGQSQIADQGTYFTGNLYDGDGLEDREGTSENRLSDRRSFFNMKFGKRGN